MIRPYSNRNLQGCALCSTRFTLAGVISLLQSSPYGNGVAPHVTRSSHPMHKSARDVG
jgi:hypothetical protein